MDDHSDETKMTTPSAAELRERYGCEVVVAGSDVLDDDPWKDPRGYVGRNKMPDYICDAAVKVSRMIAECEARTGVRHDFRIEGHTVYAVPVTDAQEHATQTWTASDDPLMPSFYGTAVSDSTPNGDGTRTVVVDLWGKAAPTVAEKWAEHFVYVAAEIRDMGAALEAQAEGHAWCTARTQLRAMRDEIDKALAEIEPLAVEQGGTPDTP